MKVETQSQLTYIMDLSTPHFLTLPRELRNRVYSYLTRQLDFDWNRGDVSKPGSSLGDVQITEPVPVRLINCPLPHVFRIHPQITEEYREVCITLLEAIINFSLHALEKLLFDPQPESDAMDNAALSQLRHITIFVKLHARTTSENLDWKNQLDLLQAVISKAPKLATLRLALQQQYYLAPSPVFNDQGVPSVLVPADSRLQNAQSSPFLPEVPLSLGDMSLVQRGEGYRVGYVKTFTGKSSLHGIIPSYTISGREHYISHGIRKIGVYTFAREDEYYSKRLWMEEEVVANWPMRRYDKEAIENVSYERAVLLKRLPHELTEWVERTGAEQVKRWA